MIIAVGKETYKGCAGGDDDGGGKVPGELKNTKSDAGSKEKFCEKVFQVPRTRRIVRQQNEQMKRIAKHRLPLA